MRRSVWRRGAASLIACVLVFVMLGAGGQDSSARFGRLGHNMMCVCGCGQVLLECNHVGCPDSDRMIGELKDQLAGPNRTGADALILNWFVAKYGATVLAAPIRAGFDRIAWIVPIGVFLLSIIGTALLVRFWTRRQRLFSAHVGQNQMTLEPDLRARIRRETEY